MRFATDCYGRLWLFVLVLKIWWALYCIYVQLNKKRWDILLDNLVSHTPTPPIWFLCILSDLFLLFFFCNNSKLAFCFLKHAKEQSLSSNSWENTIRDELEEVSKILLTKDHSGLVAKVCSHFHLNNICYNSYLKHIYWPNKSVIYRIELQLP